MTQRRIIVNSRGEYLRDSATDVYTPAAAEGEQMVIVSETDRDLIKSGFANWHAGGIQMVLNDGGQRFVALRYMKRDYTAPDGSRPVRNRIHDCETDEARDPGVILTSLLMSLGLVDGDEFEVCVTATGRRPHGDRWFLHRYNRPETDDEIVSRIEGGSRGHKDGPLTEEETYVPGP